MHKIGHKIIQLDTVDSTNNYVANLVKSDKIDSGTVILADEQTNGRGQRGTVWHVEPGMNLLFSMYVVFENLEIEHQVAINHWCAVSLNRVLSKLGVENQIKWPNDILTKSGKLAGILIENALSGRFIKHAIIGIGVNVNQTDFEAANATSVKIETGKFTPISELNLMLIEELNHWYSFVKDQQYDELKNNYLEQLWGLNKEVQFIRDNQEETGVIVGTTPFGLLEVLTKNGKEEFVLKQVKFIINN
jgi:BirA family transcriptional regulator, biotin operon repressor / biotin---[acetyl-CoA-carboxylase] ligase